MTVNYQLRFQREKLRAKLARDIEFVPPYDIDIQFACLWQYRRALTIIDLLEKEVAELEEQVLQVEKARALQYKMIEEWILNQDAPKLGAEDKALK